jgi:WD40 repeat protein
MSQNPRVVGTFTHDKAVNSVAFSPDGQRLASASDDKTARINNLGDGAVSATLTADIALSTVQFGPAGTIAAATGLGPGPRPAHSLIVFDAANGSQLWRVDVAAPQFTWCVFAPAGPLVLVVDRGAIAGRDAATGAQRWRFDVQAGQTLHDASFSFDGATLAVGVGGKDLSTGEIVLLDASSGAVLKHVALSAHVRKVAFSPGGRLLGFGADDEVGVLDTTTGALRVVPNPQVPHQGNLREVWSITFSLDDRMIGVVSSTINGITPTIRVLDVDTLTVRHELASSFSGLFAFSPDSGSVLTAEAGDLRVWDAATGATLFTLLPDVGDAKFGPDSVQVAAASGNTATVFELPVLERFRFTHDGPVTTVAYSADASRVLTASTDKTARVFDTVAGTEQSRLGHDGGVTSAVWIPGHPWFATGSADHSARIFDPTASTERLHVTYDGPVNAVAVSADGQRLATAGDDGIVGLIDVASAQQLRRFTHNAAVRVVAFNPDGSRLATGGDDGTARLFNTASGAEVMNVAHDGAVRAVAFSPDGGLLATGSADGSARVLSTRSGEELGRLQSHAPVNAVVFSADGTRLATGGDDATARIAVAASATELHRCTHDGPVHAVSFNPSATMLCTGSQDTTARVFATGTGVQRRKFIHDGPVRAVSVDHDGRMLATASDDKTARLYPLPG